MSYETMATQRHARPLARFDFGLWAVRYCCGLNPVLTLAALELELGQ